MKSSPPSPGDRNDETGWDTEFARQPGRTLLQVFRETYGDDYPEEVEPYSFVTKTDLARILHFLAIGPGSVFVDLGCGRGGPGLWFARETGADLIGIDLSPNAIRWASQRIAQFGVVGRARFLQADLCGTSLPDQSCDGAVSIDVLMLIQDKDAIMREVARILRTGAPLVFTALERGNTELYRSPLEDNGFRVEVYEETPDYRRRRLGLYERILAEQGVLLEEMGEGFHALITAAERGIADGLEDSRRALVVGRRM